jgi:hypothetical protein
MRKRDGECYLIPKPVNPMEIFFPYPSQQGEKSPHTRRVRLVERQWGMRWGDP